MFYTPKHCCECGEKIDRSKWTLLTSRRFCEICEGEFEGWEWFLRGIAGAVVLIGLIGVGSYLKKSDKPLNVATTPIGLIASNSSQIVQNSQVSAKMNVQNPVLQQEQTTNVVRTKAQTPAAALSRKSPQIKQTLPDNRQNSASEPVYFCGAQTKKGTPCSRRVKGGGRCWQHIGQPAMLAAEKLVASQ